MIAIGRFISDKKLIEYVIEKKGDDSPLLFKTKDEAERFLKTNGLSDEKIKECIFEEWPYKTRTLEKIIEELPIFDFSESGRPSLENLAEDLEIDYNDEADYEEIKQTILKYFEEKL